MTADNTLLRLLEPVMYNPELLRDTTIVISTLNHSVNAESEVFTMMLGQGIGSMGMNVSTPYSHLNLLRTFEDGLSLGTLNQGDAVAPPMVGFWK